MFGEPGVGKTRLAEEVAEMARNEHGALVLEGRCVPCAEAALATISAAVTAPTRTCMAAFTIDLQN